MLSSNCAVTIQPIEIVLPGPCVPGVGEGRHPSTGIPKERVGEGRPSAAGPGRVTSVSASYTALTILPVDRRGPAGKGWGPPGAVAENRMPRAPRRRSRPARPGG